MCISFERLYSQITSLTSLNSLSPFPPSSLSSLLFSSLYPSTAANPYLVPTDSFIELTLENTTISLRVTSRYADPEQMINLSPPKEAVSFTAEPFGSSIPRELTVLSASENPRNPYET